MVRTKKKKTLVVPRKLPLDLEEEILVRLPPLSLVRFRSVCREWKALFNSKRFANKNFACGRPEIMLHTHSDIYLISVDLNNDNPTIKVTDLCMNLRHGRYYVYGICDGQVFMYSHNEGGLVWNPLVGQAKRIAKDDEICGRDMGYVGRDPKKSYKIIGECGNNLDRRVAVLEFGTNDSLNEYWNVTHRTPSSEELSSEYSSSRVSLNGNLYWIGHNETGEYFIQMLDFSKEIRRIFCKLPCEGEKSGDHTRVLSIYKGDRFSVLQQSRSKTRTRETKIWVTEKKIGNGDDGGDVMWIKFMTVSGPDFPEVPNYRSTSYFVDDNIIYGKSFVLCCCSTKPKQGWVYIVRGDLCKKIKIDGVACTFGSSVYVPSLITIS